MKKKLHQLSILMLTAMMAVALTGCGTLFYGERRSKPTSGQIDPTVMILDCCGLILGIIPGVVAIVVDISNDTMYYSKDEWAARGK